MKYKKFVLIQVLGVIDVFFNVVFFFYIVGVFVSLFHGKAFVLEYHLVGVISLLGVLLIPDKDFLTSPKE